MKFIFYRDFRKRLLFKRFEMRRLFCLALLNSTVLSASFREYIFATFIRVYPRYSTLASFKNRCSVTNRGRGVRFVGRQFYFPLSRQTLFYKLSVGDLFPFRRSSW